MDKRDDGLLADLLRGLDGYDFEPEERAWRIYARVPRRCTTSARQPPARRDPRTAESTA